VNFQSLIPIRIIRGFCAPRSVFLAEPGGCGTDNADAWEDTIGLDGKPTKILKDGRTARFNFYDAQSSRDGRDTRIAEAIKATENAIALSGTHFTDALLALHRPGYRLLADADRGDDYSKGNAPGGQLPDDDEWIKLRRRRRRARAQLRDPMDREAGSIEEENDSAPTAAEIARAEMIDSMTNAWRRVDDTRAIPTSPGVDGDRWPLSAGDGNACMSNGRPGKLVKSEDGSCLVCELTPLDATRSGRSAGDSVPQSMTAADAAAINDQAWREYVTEMENAWR
jgi:hypothetical protein